MSSQGTGKQHIHGEDQLKKAVVIAITLLIAGVAHAQTEEWLWARNAGGISADYGRSIAVDGSGNSYVTGYFAGTAIFGSTSLTSSGGEDSYIAKLDANANFLWAKQAGGTSGDNGLSIAVDGSGNSYVTGYFQDTATFGSTSLTSSGGFEIFITKLDSNGNFLWAIKAGGTGNDYSRSIAVDGSGNSYVTGYFMDTATFGSTSLTSSSLYDLYITKLGTNGNFLWAKKAGGTGFDAGNGIGVDNSGNVYVAGSFDGTATFGSTSLSSYGSSDLYVTKLDTNGNFLWAKKAGGAGSDSGYGIAVDGSGKSSVTGYYTGTATFGGLPLTGSGGIEMFVTRLDANGYFLWAKGSVSTNSVIGNGIAVDGAGNSFATGYFSGTAAYGSTSLTSSGNYETFITKLDAYGNFLGANQAGGAGEDSGYGIAVDGGGSSYVTGYFQGTATFDGISILSSGSNDLFVSKSGWDARVLAPNGGEIWQAGSAKVIYWLFTGTGSFVNIYLSQNNGASWITLTPSPVSTALGRYSFTVPSVNSDQCLIKVVSTSNPDLYDVSDAPFTISGTVSESLTIAQPEYSKLRVGSTYPISWTATGVSAVDLEYSHNAGLSWTEIATNLPAGNGSYDWTVPDTPGGTCHLRVSSSSNPAVDDWTDNPFVISRLQLLSPNGGEIWGRQTVKTISWSSEQVTTVTLEYSLDDGVTWIQIAPSLAASAHSYNWTLPAVSSTQCRVRITDVEFPHVYDASDQPFNIRPWIILTAPNGGEYLTVNGIYSIQWSSLENVSQVQLDYSINGGSSWLAVQSTPVAASTGSYDWIVPDNPSANCRVRVSHPTYTGVYDVSDAAFTIVSSIQPPEVQFSADLSSGPAPLSVQFTDQSNPGTGDIINWAWDFGDGNTSTLPNPQHIYAGAGLYSVTLSVTNAAGANSSLMRGDYINVMPGHPVIVTVPDGALDFGNVYIGSQSEPFPLWIKNTGTAILNVSDITFGTAGSPFWMIPVNLPVNVAGGDSIAVLIVFSPQVAGPAIDQLTIYNNSNNQPLFTLELSGSGEYVPPKPPQGVAATQDGENVVISWEAVTETELGTPIVPDYYLVFYNGSPDPNGLYYFHGATPSLSYTHYLVGTHAQYMFYRVLAYKHCGRSPFDLSSLQTGMPERDVLQLLDDLR